MRDMDRLSSVIVSKISKIFLKDKKKKIPLDVRDLYRSVVVGVDNSWQGKVIIKKKLAPPPKKQYGSVKAESHVN